MATVKIKFRPSSVAGKKGTLYYQIIHNRIVRQINIGYHVFAWEWDNGRLLFPSQEEPPTARTLYLVAMERRIQQDIDRIETIIRRLDRLGRAYSSEQVVEIFFATDQDESRLGVFVRVTAKQLRRIGKMRLAETYTSSLNSFMRFRGDKGDLRFEEMTSDMMMEYEAYLKEQGLVPNTTSFYMRNLRAVYNRAVEKGLTVNRAPFRHVYTGIEKTLKRAVSSEVMREIKSLDLSSNARQAQARDLFLFSFYTRGMSFVDMAMLKKKDLQNGILAYRRKKTDQQLFIKWEKPMQDIVDKYSDPASPYLLPIITLSGNDERRQYLTAIHRMNARLKEIGKKMKSPVHLTSYVARHGWASIAKSRNVPIAVISEAMGHDSEHTTRIYLASLASSVVDNANSKVIYSV